MLKRALLLVLLAAACDKTPSKRLADFSQTAIAKRVEVLRADVEAALGGEIGPVTVKIVTAEELAAILVPEMEALRAEVANGPRGDELKEACETEAKMVSYALLGKVGADDGVLHVCPENFRRLAAIDPSWGPIESPAGLDIILIHELAHVWQHRRYTLRKLLGKPRSLDELMARSSVLEGHAQFITRAVAQERGIRHGFDLLVNMQTKVPPSIEDASVRQSIEIINAQTGFTYEYGLRMWDEVVAALGREAAEKRLFTQPPLTSLAVERKGEYLNPSAAPDFDLDRATRQIKRYLEEMDAGAVNVGPILRAALRAVLKAGGEVAERAVEDVIRGTGMSNKELMLGLVLCKSPDAARALLHASLVDVRARVTLFSGSETSLTIVGDDPLDVGDNRITAHLLDLEVVTGGESMRMERVMFAEGDVFVEVVGLSHHVHPRRIVPRIAALLAKPSPWSGQPRERAIATMQVSLVHADWSVRWRAVRNLARLLEKDPTLRQPLRAALKDESVAVRVAAVRALGVTELDDESDWEVRAEACRAGAVESETAEADRVARLVRWLDDPSPYVQLVACDRLRDIDRRAKVDLATVKRLYASSNARVRLAALRFLRYGERDRASGKLVLRALDDKDPDVRARAARRVGRYESIAAESLSKLINLLDDGMVSVQRAAVEGIGDIAMPPYRSFRLASEKTTSVAKAVPRILAMLDEKDLRDAAAEALAKFGDEAKPAVPRLVRALGSDDNGFAFRAARALWNIDHDKETLLPVFVETLRNGDEWDRSDAAEYLGKMGEPAHQYIPDLIVALGSSNKWTRKDAARALGKFGPAAKDALPALRKLLEDDDVKERAEEAIAAIER